MRPCLDCGQPTDGSRCPLHRRARHNAMYGHRWQKLSRTLRTHVRRCQQCGSPDDLTVDHVKPGSLEDGVAVLCRSCNSSKSSKSTSRR